MLDQRSIRIQVFRRGIVSSTSLFDEMYSRFSDFDSLFVRFVSQSHVKGPNIVTILYYISNILHKRSYIISHCPLQSVHTHTSFLHILLSLFLSYLRGYRLYTILYNLPLLPLFAPTYFLSLSSSKRLSSFYIFIFS